MQLCGVVKTWKQTGLFKKLTKFTSSSSEVKSSFAWEARLADGTTTEMISMFKNAGIRTSIFCDPDIQMVEGAKETGTDRIELYTEGYAKQFKVNAPAAIEPYLAAAERARKLGLGINAGHDLDLHNLNFLVQNIPYLDEVSIGHALITDALYFGLENTVQMYKRKLDLKTS